MSLRMCNKISHHSGLQPTLHHTDGLENFKYKVVREQKSTQVPGSRKGKSSLGNESTVVPGLKKFPPKKKIQRKMSNSLKKINKSPSIQEKKVPKTRTTIIRNQTHKDL